MPTDTGTLVTGSSFASIVKVKVSRSKKKALTVILRNIDSTNTATYQILVSNDEYGTTGTWVIYATADLAANTNVAVDMSVAQYLWVDVQAKEKTTGTPTVKANILWVTV